MYTSRSCTASRTMRKNFFLPRIRYVKLRIKCLSTWKVQTAPIIRNHHKQGQPDKASEHSQLTYLPAFPLARTGGVQVQSYLARRRGVSRNPSRCCIGIICSKCCTRVVNRAVVDDGVVVCAKQLELGVKKLHAWFVWRVKAGSPVG